MRNNNIEIHQSEINKIDNGWEYICQTCGYHAKYVVESDGTRKLEIVFPGNTRHTGETLDLENITHLESQIEDVLNSYVRKYGEW